MVVANRETQAIQQITQKLNEANASVAGKKVELNYLREHNLDTTQCTQELHASQARLNGAETELKHLKAPSKGTIPRGQRGRFRLPSESDDEEEIPLGAKVKLEKKKAPLTAWIHPKKAPAPMGSAKRKRDLGVSGLSLDDALDDSDSMVDTPATTSQATGYSSRKKARGRAPPTYRPLPTTPLPRPNWTQTPTPASSKFQTPTVSERISLVSDASPEETHQETPSKRRRADAVAANRHNDTASKTPQNPTPAQAYAEIIDFEFIFIVKYLNASKTQYDFHSSADLSNTMSAFWTRLKTLLDEWENDAGADWAWELQQAPFARKRVCVARRLAKLPTRWRRGDCGFFACHACALAGMPCFTWVADDDEEGEDEEGAEQSVRAPRGWSGEEEGSGDERCFDEYVDGSEDGVVSGSGSECGSGSGSGSDGDDGEGDAENIDDSELEFLGPEISQ
ncbi:hypothetical protein Q7P37_010887 [Cladosporium fusiforme]